VPTVFTRDATVQSIELRQTHADTVRKATACEISKYRTIVGHDDVNAMREMRAQARPLNRELC